MATQHSSPSSPGLPAFRTLRSLFPFSPNKQATPFVPKSHVSVSTRSFVSFGSMRRSLHLQRERASSTDVAPILAAEPSTDETSFRRSVSLSTLDNSRVQNSADVEPHPRRPEIRFENVDDTALSLLRQTPSADTFVAQDLSTILEADTSRDIPTSSFSSFSRFSPSPGRESTHPISSPQRLHDTRDQVASFNDTSVTSFRNDVSDSSTVADPTVRQLAPLAIPGHREDTDFECSKDDPSLDLSALDPDLKALLSPNRLDSPIQVSRLSSLSLSILPHESTIFASPTKQLGTEVTLPSKTPPKPRSRLPKPRSTSSRLPLPSVSPSASASAYQRRSLLVPPTASYPFPPSPPPPIITTTDNYHGAIPTSPQNLTSSPSPTEPAFPPARPRLPGSFGSGLGIGLSVSRPSSRRVTPTYTATTTSTPPSDDSVPASSRHHHPSTPSTLRRASGEHFHSYVHANKIGAGTFDTPFTLPRSGPGGTSRHSSLQSRNCPSYKDSQLPPPSPTSFHYRPPPSPLTYASASASTHSLRDLHDIGREVERTRASSSVPRGRMGSLTSSALYSRRAATAAARDGGSGLGMGRSDRRLRERSSSVGLHDHPRRRSGSYRDGPGSENRRGSTGPWGGWGTTSRSPYPYPYRLDTGSHHRVGSADGGDEREVFGFGIEDPLGQRPTSSLSGNIEPNARRNGNGHVAADWLNPRTVRAFRAAGLLGGPGIDGFRDDLRTRSKDSVPGSRTSRREYWRPSNEYWSHQKSVDSGRANGGDEENSSSFKVGEAESPTYTYTQSSSADASPRRDTTRSVSTAPTSASGSGSVRVFGSGSGSGLLAAGGTGSSAPELSGELEGGELQELRDRHTTETTTLLSALADSQKAAKTLRRENGELRMKLDRLQSAEVENEELRRHVTEMRRKVEEMRRRWTGPPAPRVSIGQTSTTGSMRRGRMSQLWKEGFGDTALDDIDPDFVESSSPPRSAFFLREGRPGVDELRTPEMECDEDTFALGIANPVASSTPAASSSSKAKMQHRRRFSTTSSVQLPTIPANMTMLLHDEDYYDEVGRDEDARVGASFVSDFGIPNFASLENGASSSPSLLLPPPAETSILSNAFTDLSMTSTVSAQSLSLKPEHETHLNDLKNLDLTRGDEDW